MKLLTQFPDWEMALNRSKKKKKIVIHLKKTASTAAFSFFCTFCNIEHQIKMV